MVVHKHLQILDTVMTRFEFEDVNLTRGNSIPGTGYSLYSGSYTFKGPVIRYGTLDIIASGPGGNVEETMVDWTALIRS
jgi:hypothetical protein